MFHSLQVRKTRSHCSLFPSPIYLGNTPLIPCASTLQPCHPCTSMCRCPHYTNVDAHTPHVDACLFYPRGKGSTILLGCRTMLGECCLAAIQPKGFWTKLRDQERERERESVCVCVCVCVNMKVSLQTKKTRLCIRSCIVSY
jgi:hypothetical protein